ncbi:MAG: DUF4139 domain-containing protein, partial [Pseudomonadota bacterium]
RTQLEQQRRDLLVQRGLVEREIERARAQRRLMENLANGPLPTPISGGNTGAAIPRPALDVAALGQLFDLIGARMAVADEAIAAAEKGLRQLDEQLERLEQRLALVPGTPKRQLVLLVPIRNFSDATVTTTLDVTYQVQGASWSPLYEGRLSVKSAAQPEQAQIAGELLLTRRAQISQSSGEDWSGVKLTLSTSRPSGRTTAPELTPLLVDFRRPRPRPSGGAGGMMSMSRDQAQVSAAPSPRMAGRVQAKRSRAQRAEQAIAATTAQTFQETYAIPGTVDVPANGQSKQVVIGELALAAPLTHRAVPERDPTVYLAAQLKLPQDVRLLPGQIALFRDGVYIGTGSLPQLAGGSEHMLGFGQDDRVLATFDPGEDTRGKSGTFTTSNTQRRTFVVTLTNRHTRPVTVQVQGQLPVSRNEEIEVAALGAALQPAEKDVERKRGVLAWNVTVASNAEEKLNYGYAMSWPQDKEVTMRNGR